MSPHWRYVCVSFCYSMCVCQILSVYKCILLCKWVLWFLFDFTSYYYYSVLLLLIIITTSIYIVLFQLRSKRFTVYYYPGHGIQIQLVHCQSTLSATPWGACIPASHHFAGTLVPTHHMYRSHPTGSPFIHLGRESFNVDVRVCAKVTKVPGDVGIELGLSAWVVEQSHHYTTAPPLIHIISMDHIQGHLQHHCQLQNMWDCQQDKNVSMKRDKTG